MKLSESDFAELARSHKTGEDHLKLAAGLAAHALKHEKDAKLYEELAGPYEQTHPLLAGEARHYAAHSSEAAEALRNLAKIHEELAKGHSHAAHAK